MIDSLQISRFKCFQQVSLAMRSLTMLTGINGGGKSTILQSLLLSRLASTSASRAVRLNGPYELTLGTAADVLHRSASEPIIDIMLSDTTTSAEWAYQFAVPEAEDALYLTATRVPTSPVPGISNPAGGFTYLCAERLGPRDALSVSAQEPDEIGVGVHGEFTAQVLALRETRAVGTRRVVRDELQHPDVNSSLVRLQAEAWASDIVRPIRISAQMATGILASTIRFQQTDQYAQMIRPANAGFGVSYALPIIVAGLLTLPGDMLLVENPEAHLHPAGQSKLGHFLARIAGAGVQVVVETHSDHVLNGVRLAVTKGNLLSPSDIVVHYFDDESTTSININDRGELSHWPKGFFDQIDADLGGLARARQRQ